jgi:hypothetical protein
MRPPLKSAAADVVASAAGSAGKDAGSGNSYPHYSIKEQDQIIEAIRAAPSQLLLRELITRKEYDLGILNTALSQLGGEYEQL